MDFLDGSIALHLSVFFSARMAGLRSSITYIAHLFRCLITPDLTAMYAVDSDIYTLDIAEIR